MATLSLQMLTGSCGGRGCAGTRGAAWWVGSPDENACLLGAATHVSDEVARELHRLDIGSTHTRSCWVSLEKQVLSPRFV